MSEFIDNVNVRPELIGLENLLAPFAQFTSASRRIMMSVHVGQSLTLNHAETARIQTGYEAIVGDYDFNQTKLSEDIVILGKIPKYTVGIGPNPITHNPRITVIYQGLTTNEINYFHLDTYTMGSDDYGYMNKWMNTHLLEAGQYIPKNTDFCSSYVKNDNKYNLGVNANVIYMTLPETDQDAFIISESLAKKMETTSINKLNISIKSSHIPLNLYGDDENYKIFPDIGETVNKNGIIGGFRKPTDSTFVHDVLKENLKTIQYLHDSLYYVHDESTVLDLDFYINKSKYVQQNMNIYAQVFKYYSFKKEYHKNIVDIYYYCVDQGWKISPAFNTLVTYAMEMMLAEKQAHKRFKKSANVVLVKKKTPIEFIDVTITYMYTRKVTKGFKLSSRAGHKGIIGSIWLDKDMPTDDYGIKADIIISPESVMNRMNISQLWEQMLNRYNVIIARETINIRNDTVNGGTKPAYDYATTYMRKINPNYVDIIDKVCIDDKTKEQFLLGIEQEGIYLIIPPFLKTINKDLALDLAKTYDPHISPITYTRRDDHGNVLVTTRTKESMWIGAIYLYLLYKIPHCMASGLGYVSHLKIPMKPSPLAKLQYPMSQTPIRFGEDENRYFNMVCLDPTITARLYGLYGLSPEASQQVALQLLNEKYPSLINNIHIDTTTIVNTNHVIGIFNHMLATIGVDSKNTRCKVSDIIKLPKTLRFESLERAVRNVSGSQGHDTTSTK
jgi:DNA-directed RNA polymerase beta subunit